MGLITWLKRRFSEQLCEHEWEVVIWEYGEEILLRCKKCALEISDPD